MLDWWTLSPVRLSTVISLAIAVSSALTFLLVTGLTGDYSWVARLGGAGWVFLLSIIILMPTVTPWVKKRMNQHEGRRSL